jgi:hypothetical protein
MTILILSIAALVLSIAIPLVILYATVRFIKWAWYAGSTKNVDHTREVINGQRMPSWYGESSKY